MNEKYILQATTTLYAMWEKKATYSVIYDGNGNTAGEIPIDGNTYYSGDIATILDQGSLIKEGFIFTGWNTSADGNGENYKVNGSFVIGMQRSQTNYTLYAQWERVSTVNPPSVPNVEDKAVETNDTTNVAVYLFMLLISGLYLVIKKVKKLN